MNLPPITISFMLTHYFSPCPEEHLGHDHYNSMAGQETVKWLKNNGLLDEHGNATDRGRAWVKFICSTPLPEQNWVLPPRSMSKPDSGRASIPETEPEVGDRV